MVTSWNKGAERLYGFKAQEMIGAYIETIVPADCKQELEEILRQLKAGQRIDHFETVRRRKDGAMVDVSITISPVRDATGKLIGASTISRDITERKQMEQKLRASEELFRALIEHSADAIALIDAAGKVLYVSPSTQRILGYEPDELMGRNAFELIHPDDLETTIGVLALILEQGKSLTVECRGRHKDGSWRWLETSGTNLLDNPSVGAIVANFRDITERKELEEMIWKSQRQLQTILDGSPAVIYLKDIQGRYILVNQQYERVCHITKQQVIGKTDYDLFPEAIARTFRSNDQEVLKAGREGAWEEVLPQGDGLYTYLSVKFPLFDPTGSPYAVCSISTDITERKELERRKDEFISMASHKLKTPLTSVKVYTQLLQRMFEKEDRQEANGFLSRMDIQINKLNNLITDLLDISRMQAGNLPLLKEVVDMNPLAREVVENLQ